MNQANRSGLIGVICLLLAGCVTPPFETGRQRERVVEAAGFEAGEVRFMNYCFFEAIQEEGVEEVLKGKRGIVILTDDELCLMDGVSRNAPVDYFLKVSLSELDGVHSSESQIQIKYSGILIVLFLHNWNDMVSSPNLTQELYESLILANVPRFETSDYYSFSRIKPPAKLTSFPEYKEFPSGSLQSIRSEQAARDRETELIYGRRPDEPETSN